MSDLGMGVMIRMLGGNAESVAALGKSIGKTIVSAVLDAGNDHEDALVLMFSDGAGLRIADHGQSCCENRYMVTDDDLAYYAGSTFMGAEVRDAPTTRDEYDDAHEVQFLLITTSKGTFTMATHNEHNGYYGGFAVACSEVQP